MGKIICPKCEKDDQIQKVTSIVTGGVSTSTYVVHGAFYNAGSGTSVSQTQLASRLSPPPKPKNRWAVSSFPEALGVVGWGIMGGILFMVISGESFFTNATPFVIGFFVGIAAILLIIFFSSQQTQKKIPNWEKQISNWRELYYCYRDDCVFDPKTKKHTSPEGIERLL